MHLRKSPDSFIVLSERDHRKGRYKFGFGGGRLMLYRIFAFIVGFYRFTLPKSEKLLTELMLSGKAFGTASASGESMTIDVISLSSVGFRKIVSDTGFRITSEEKIGLPFVLMRYRKRAGIYIGAALFVFLLYFPSMFIWEINVTGGKAVAPETVLDGLEKQGLTIGSPIRQLDVNKICTDYLLSDGSLSWISINIIGTKAEVVVRDFTESDPETEKNPSNLIAECDGFIDSIELFSGQAVVASGDSVHKGQVLVSGFYQGRNESVYRLEHSDAHIYARIVKNYTETVPLIGEKPITTGRVTKYRFIFFFGKKLSFFGDHSDPYESSEAKTSLQKLTVFGHALPIGFVTVEYRETVMKDFSIDEKEAEKLAEKRMADRISSEMPNAQVLSVTQSVSCDGAVYTLHSRIYCIDDIAKQVPITASGEQKE